jgi:hypothetical protein
MSETCPLYLQTGHSSVQWECPLCAFSGHCGVIRSPRRRGVVSQFEFLSFRALGAQLEWAHSTGSEKGLRMALDTTTFLIVLVAAIVVVGLVIGLMFRSENKKRS